MEQRELLGQKLPLKQRDIWRILANMEHEHNLRELAMFDLAIDSKRRACDLTALYVRDVLRGDQVVVAIAGSTKARIAVSP